MHPLTIQCSPVLVDLSTQISWFPSLVEKKVKGKVNQNCRTVAICIYHRIQIGSDKYVFHQKINALNFYLLISSESSSIGLASRTFTSPPCVIKI